MKTRIILSLLSKVRRGIAQVLSVACVIGFLINCPLVRAQTVTYTFVNNTSCSTVYADYLIGVYYVEPTGDAIEWEWDPEPYDPFHIALGSGQFQTIATENSYQPYFYGIQSYPSGTIFPYLGQNMVLSLGCDGSILSAGTAINDNHDGVPSPIPPTSNPSCGMPVWSVSEPYISLWLKDQPLGYQPALGPRISFELAFNQRESLAGFNQGFFNTGKRWDFSWSSYVVQVPGVGTNGEVNGTNNVVYFPDGGSTTYYTTNDYLTDTTLTGDTTNGFTLTYPDGHKDIYSEIVTVTNSSGVFMAGFLTQRWDAQSNKTTLKYASYSPIAPIIHLQYVVDGDGRTNSIFYATNNAYSTNLIAKVTDPFGRSTILSYDDNGHLTNIVDVMTNSTSFNYDTNDWVTNMVTPYGTTSFTLTDNGTNAPPNGRSVLVTRPDGSHEYYLYQDNAPGIASSYPTNQAPSTP